MAPRARRLVPFVLALLALVMGGLSAARAQEPPADLRITLERTSCAGDCPVYTVALDGNGTVTFEGRAHVRQPGRQTRQVAPADVQQLLREAEQAGFFATPDEVTTAAGQPPVWIIDAPVAVVTIARNGRTTRVQSVPGDRGFLSSFAGRIDTIAQTRPWIRLDLDTLRERVREHQRPTARELQDELRIALEHDDVEVVRALLDLGADANAVAVTVDAPMLMLAQSPAATQLLLDAGAAPFATAANGLSALWLATMKSPATVRVLLKAGVPVDHPADEDGHTALWLAACYGNVETVTLLLNEGANPAVRFDNVSPVDCARQAQARRRQEGASPLDGPSPFEQDFDDTIARLERALATQARR